jgi:uncharacterized protein YjdB
LTQSVTWSSSNTAIATVSAGLVTGLTQGSVTIAASFGSGGSAASLVSANAAVTVTPPVLSSVSISPAQASITAGLTQQLTANAKYSDGSIKDVTQSATWTSANSTLASVAAGLVTGLAQGVVTVTASFGGVPSASAAITINPAALTSIAVAPLQISIAPGTKQQFTATGTFTDGGSRDVTATVNWSSSNTAAATISNGISTQGLATAVAAGQSTITAKSGTIQASAILNVSSVTPVSITVNPANASIPIGTTQAYSALATFSDNSSQDVTTVAGWTSSKNSVASITTGGIATAKAAGSSNITATFGGVSQTTSLTVNLSNLTAIQIQPGNITLAENTSQQFSVIGVFSDGGTRNITTQATWVSSNPGVAAFPKNGGLTITALSPGQTTVTATVGAISGTTTVNVTNATITSLSITPANASVAAGTQESFTAAAGFSDGSTQIITNNVTWTSDNSAVATISDTPGSNGIATALSAGTCNISASFGGQFASVPFDVNQATLVSIAVTPGTTTLTPASTLQYSAIGTYSDGTTANLNRLAQWSTSDPTVATVTNFGLATGQAAGSTTITAQLGSVIAPSASLVVAGTALVSIAVTPGNNSVPALIATQFTATGTFADNSQQDLTLSATWTSSQPEIATVSNVGGTKGLATGVAAGPPATTISALFAGKLGTAVLSVTGATLSSISVTPNPVTVSVGNTEQFTAIGTFSDSSTLNLTTQVSWESTNIATAVVNNFGLASAAGTGTTTVDATLNGITGTANLTVQ